MKRVCLSYTTSLRDHCSFASNSTVPPPHLFLTTTKPRHYLPSISNHRFIHSNTSKMAPLNSQPPQFTPPPPPHTLLNPPAQSSSTPRPLPSTTINGDLNNTSSMRPVLPPVRNAAFAYRSLAIPASEDDPAVRQKYRPFILPDHISSNDWTNSVELATATEMSHNDFLRTGSRLRILVLYGSLRKR